MDKHLKQAPNCGCNMTFKNKKHRTFHMQTVHLKEKIGCTRKVTIEYLYNIICYYTLLYLFSFIIKNNAYWFNKSI